MFLMCSTKLEAAMCTVMATWDTESARYPRPADSLQAVVKKQFGALSPLNWTVQVTKLLGALFGPSEHDWPRWSDEALALAPPTGIFWTEIPATGDVTFVGAMAQTLHLVAGEGKAHLNFCVASRGVQGAMTGLGHLLQDAKAAPSPADGQPQSVRLTFAQMTCPGVSSARVGRARSGNPNAVTVSPLVLEERVRPKTNMHPGIRVVLISHESVLLLM